MKPLTLKQAKEGGYYVYLFDNGCYKYGANKDETDRTEHLVRGGEEIARGTSVFSHKNGDYEYKADGYFHRFDRNDNEIID